MSGRFPVVAGVILLVVLGPIVGIWAYGMSLPAAYTACATTVVQAPPGQVWATITDWEGQTTWRKDIERRFQEGSKRMDRHDLRLQALEQTVQGMPGKDDMHRLELQLSEIAGDMKGMSATMLGMSQSMARTEKIVGRHDEHLMGDRS